MLPWSAVDVPGVLIVAETAGLVDVLAAGGLVVVGAMVWAEQLQTHKMLGSR